MCYFFKDLQVLSKIIELLTRSPLFPLAPASPLSPLLPCMPRSPFSPGKPGIPESPLGPVIPGLPKPFPGVPPGDSYITGSHFSFCYIVTMETYNAFMRAIKLPCILLLASN